MSTVMSEGMSTDLKVAPLALTQAGSVMTAGSASVAAIQLPLPNPAMYGQLVGSAAADAEPRTAEQLNDVIAALAELFATTGSGLNTTGGCYEQLEQRHMALVRSGIEGVL